MRLLNATILGTRERSDIVIEGPSIKAISNSGKQELREEELVIDTGGALVFPGLINSHDHLDFDLFPRIGNSVYTNYIEWGEDIQANNQDLISPILRIPRPLRLEWGIYKNLLCGVTTVVHHGEAVAIGDAPIDVFDKCQSIHSIDRDKYWKFRLNRFVKTREPVAIHIGEGVDPAMHREISRGTHWNLLRRKLVAIHGIAMDTQQAASFAALTWCPVANHFLYRQSAAISELSKKTRVLFGTDSTLTGSWNIWDHLRFARQLGQVADEELLAMLTDNPRQVWEMPGKGLIAVGCDADLVVVDGDKGCGQMDNFFNTNPEQIGLIVHRGVIILFDENWAGRLSATLCQNQHFSRVKINGATKYVLGNLPGLMKKISSYYPGCPFPVSPAENLEMISSTA
jgi:cytosine/adenosine deaminase-related metal-dependent hydrolase